MIIAIIVVFILGYMAIALEHPLKVDKTASALFLGMLLWTMYAVGVLLGDIFPDRNMDLLNGSIIEHMGDISEILFFLIGAMTIVELIDVHGGFSVITERITTRKKRKLLWLLCFVTFFMSAVLDNLTTSIVMVMLLRKLISEHKRAKRTLDIRQHDSNSRQQRRSVVSNRRHNNNNALGTRERNNRRNNIQSLFAESCLHGSTVAPHLA